MLFGVYGGSDEKLSAKAYLAPLALGSSGPRAAEGPSDTNR